MLTNNMFTENLDPTHSTSDSSLLDFFFKIGAMRFNSEKEIVQAFIKAASEDEIAAMRTLFCGRDVRGGQGERRLFRVIIKWLGENYPKTALKVLHLIPFYGRWDDMLVLLDTEIAGYVAEYLWENSQKDPLCAKWLPREKSANHKYAVQLARFWGFSRKKYRRWVVDHSRTVEQKMSANKWEEIDYEQVPSMSMLRHRNAFQRHDPIGWEDYMESLEKGEAKINAKVLYPSDIVGQILNGDDDRTLSYQWEELPNWVSSNDFIPVCDVSGSMTGKPMEVSIGLGLYLSERNIGPFQDQVITFASKPQFHYIQGRNIVERVSSLEKADWGMSTNLRAVFSMILERGEAANLSPEEMPKYVLIISDMNFDRACSRQSTFDDITEMYEQSGYKRPQLVFWNVNAFNDSTPVKVGEHGTALVSGYSPSIVKNLLQGELEPAKVMWNTILDTRYNYVTDALMG